MNVLRTHAKGFVTMCQIPPRIHIVPTQMCPPIRSSMLLIDTIHPSPPNGDFKTYPKITAALTVGLKILRTSPPPGAQVS